MSEMTPATDLDEDEGAGNGGALGDLGELEPVRDPLVDEEGRLRLSYSRIDTYQRCPAQFRYQYIDGIPGEPSPHLSFGTSIHSALERFYDRKLPDPPSEDELVAYLYDAWETTGFEQMERDEQLGWYRHGQEVLRRFHSRQAASFRLPADVEKWFELPFGDDIVVVGSIDRVDVDEHGDLEIIDYKTSKKVRDQKAVRASLQLAIYALACEHLYGRLPAYVTLDFVVAGVAVRVAIEEIDLDAARAEITRVAEAVRAELFDPAPNRLCAWCDYRLLCPAWDGDGPDVLGPAMLELERLQRSVRRDVATMRRLESTVDRLRAASGNADA